MDMVFRTPRWGIRFLIGFALSLGFLLPLNSNSLWFDEVFTANLTLRQSPYLLLRELKERDVHPPLSYLLFWGWRKILGLPWEKRAPEEGEEGAYRFPSLLFTAASSGLLASSIPPPWGYVASALYLSSPLVHMKAHEARMYPMLGFFLLAALIGFTQGNRFLFGASSLLALYTHYLAGLFLLPFWALTLRRAPHTLLWLAPFLLWVPAVLEQLGKAKGTEILRGEPLLGLYAYIGNWADPEGFLLFSLSLLALYLLYKRLGEAPGAEGLLATIALTHLFPFLWYASSLLVNTVEPRYYGAFAAPFLYPTFRGLAETLRWWAEISLTNQFRWRVQPTALALGLLGVLGMAAVKIERPLPTEEGYRAFALASEKIGKSPLYGNEVGRVVSTLFYARHLERGAVVDHPPEDLPESFYLVLFPLNVGNQEGVTRLVKCAKENGYKEHRLVEAFVQFSYWKRTEAMGGKCAP